MTGTHNISIYAKANQTKGGKVIPLDIFLDQIRSGEWQDLVLKLRTISDPEARRAAKTKVPGVTVSGTFAERTDAGLREHSGYIAIDIDDVADPEELKSLVCADKYVAAAFTSISGRGLCLLFRITPTKHREAFQGISEYLHTTYGLVCDPTAINVSRLRFVSYDPTLYANLEGVERFAEYPKTKPPRKIERVIYAQNDFEKILEQVVSRRLNLCENYHEWMRIAFALVHQFGEGGRSYFHTLSQFSSKYDADVTDKQYTACLKHQGSGSQATIATFYYYAKQAGVRIYSDRTKRIITCASAGKRSGLSAAQITANLEKFEDIDDADGGDPVLPLVEQVMAADLEAPQEEGLIEQLEAWLRQTYNLRKNSVTRMLETDGKVMQQREYDSMFIATRKNFDKVKGLEKVTYELLTRLIHSDFVPEYNPFLEWFREREAERKWEVGHIEKLFGSVQCPDRKFLLYFGTKWLVGIISAMHGKHSPLLLALTGGQNTGKTEFFRRLLPDGLRSYYAESKLEDGKDDQIMMTKKLIIMDDEMGGANKKDPKALKNLTSRASFTLREPYGQSHVDLPRLAVLCGTSNERELLNDPDGNRRIIPVQVLSIDHAAYNAVDKTALLMEAYQMWKDGFKWELNKEDVAELHAGAEHFEEVSLEGELIARYFRPDGPLPMTASDIKVYLDRVSNQRLSLRMIGLRLRKLGFVPRMEKRDGRSMQLYYVHQVSTQPI